MKKILLATVAVIALSTFSQAQFKVGIKAGGNLSDQRISGGNAVFSKDDFGSYHAGLVGDVRIAGNFYLQPQLLYTRKGATLLNATGAADTKVRFNYVELPVYALYKLPVPFGKVFGGAGAVYSYGFNGKQEQNGQKKQLYSDINDWKRHDLSLGFAAGVEFDNGIFASINSQQGLLNVYKADGISVKNRSVSVSVGYMIDWNAFKRKS